VGHVHVGRLPRHLKWQQIARRLGANPRDSARISAAILNAADARLRYVANDAAVTTSFYLLARLAAASHTGEFLEEAQRLGIQVGPDSDALEFIAAVGDRVRAERSHSGHFEEIAVQSLQGVLLHALGSQGPDLFNSRIEQVREGLRRNAGGRQFGRMAEAFFGQFTARFLSGVLDRELSNHTGRSTALRTAEDTAAVSAQVHEYGIRSGALAREFGTDWYAKHVLRADEPLQRASASGFVADALRKMRSELKAAGGA
jgi:hypothetical protein